MHFLKSLSILAIVGMTSAYPTVEDTTPAALQARAALTAQTMVANINNITQQSQNLQPVVSSIQSNGLRRRQNNPFEPVINGLQAIINTATDDVTAMEGLVPYSVTTDEQDICDAFHNFVLVHQVLLKLLIGKSGLLESIFLGPVAAALRSLESAVDELAFGIIDSVPYCADAATNDKSNLDDTLGKAVCAYTPGGTLGIDLFC